LHEFYHILHAFAYLSIIFTRVIMETLRQHIKPGQVYRRSDLEYYSSSIDRHLGMLTKDGSLIKLSQGVYYAPKSSKFGLVPPDDHQMVERFLKDEDFLLVSPNSYNSLGLGLTQMYNTIWVYNHKRKGDIQLNGRTFEFKLKSSFPKSITKEYLLVDLFNNLDNLAEDTDKVIQLLRDKIQEFDLNALVKDSQQYGCGKTKKCIKGLLRKLFVTY
jgi:hypothetical protein